MGKKIAFIGSSGGNLYKQGGNDLPAMMKELFGQTKAADMEIVFVQYVLASGSLDNVGPDSPATLFTWNGKEVQPVFQGTLREVDAEAAKVDAQLAKKINDGEIDVRQCQPGRCQPTNHGSLCKSQNSNGRNWWKRCRPDTEYGLQCVICIWNHRYNQPDQSGCIHNSACKILEH